MKKSDGVLSRLVQVSDLPDERLPNQSLVEIIENKRVLIENHQGVRAYETTSIHVKVKFGTVCVSGCKLELTKMSKGQLIITGDIESVKLIRG